MERLIQNIPSDWKIVELGKVGEVVNGLTYSPDDVDETGVLVLRSSNIQNGNLCFKDNVFVKVNESNFNAVQSNDILICVRNGSRNLIGKNTIIPKGVEGLAFGAFMTVYRSKFNPFFIHVFNTEIYYHQINQNLGATINSINNSDLKKFKVPFPPLPEQQKIAAILSKWDELIETQTQLINTKEKQKTSLMQKLLTGEVRFPGFEDEWKMKKLGDIGKIKMCKRIFNHQTLSEGDIPFYKIGTFGKKADAFISNELYEEYKNKFSFPLKGEILISAAGTLGRTVVYDGKPAFFQDSNIVWLSHNETKVLNRFLYFVYQTVRYESEGGTIQRLYNSIIYDVDIYLPSIEEQNKIATFLTYTDEEIRNLKTELEAMKLQKKGLMQHLLTGKIRVNN